MSYNVEDGDSTSVSTVNTLEAIERHLLDQHQDSSSHEDDNAEALTEARERYTVAKRLFDRNTQLLCDCSIRQFGRLDMALQYISEPCRRQMVMFARDRPKLQGVRLVHVKQYLAGYQRNFFKYSTLASNEAVGVNLDEVIRSDDPVPMYFDIEIKQRSAVGAVCDPKVILEAHCGANGLNVPEADISRIASGYKEAAVLPFSEEECQVGLTVVQNFLSTILSQLVSPRVGGFFVLSCCRPAKFSLHVICSSVYCDGSYLSAPLLAYEVARRFVNWNLACILAMNQATVERTFRLRALMIDHWVGSMEVSVVNGNISQRPKFTGYNDTPFDESVYTRHHLMRAAGATKGDGLAPALVPVTYSDDRPVRVMNDTKSFSAIFPFSDGGRDQWLLHLITRSTISDDSVVVAGWTPSRYYPQRRGWFAKKKAHPRIMSDLEGQFAQIVTARACDFYEETRYTGRDYETSLSHNHPLGPVRAPKEPITADDMFVSEDGTLKAFKFFKPNDYIRHDHGTGVEANASARVFPGGFRCFACQMSFGVVEEASEEEPFHCTDMRIVTTNNPEAQIPLGRTQFNWAAEGIDWDVATQKKWFVVQAPMGSGKTEQLVSFMSGPALQRGWRVLVVSFRQYLASQQSMRLGTYCYLGLTNQEIRADPSPLTICLNSLWKLGDQNYDAILLDEAGLIRRHFLSSTVTSVLVQVYEKFCRLIRGAEFVVMLQASLSQEDVQFYTEIDGVQAEDCNRISGFKLVKPLKVHPIEWTTDCFQAFANMVQRYKTSFDASGCRQPFMVFCSQCNFAEYIVEYLKDVAGTIEGADPDRVKGIWAALKNKNDPFCLRFVEDAGQAATECDVLVCTSVIGAGFSVSRHFPSFHAFLFNNILDHHEEQQFIQRLRVKLDDTLREGVSRNSFMFVEKGHGNGLPTNINVLRQDLDRVRVLMTSDASFVPISAVSVMQNTQAQIETERAVSRAKHDTLWIEWGLSVESPFAKFPEGSEDEKKQWTSMKVAFMQRNAKKRLDVADMLRQEYEEIGMSEYFAAIELGPGLRLFRALASTEQILTLEKAFQFPNLATKLIELKFLDKKSQDKCLGGKTQLNNLAKASWRLAQWISRVYKDISQERTGSFFDHAAQKPYATTYMQHFALYNFALDILQPMLSDLDGQKPYLLCPGSTPFFHGLKIVLDQSICEDLKARLEPRSTDDEQRKEYLETMRSFVRTFMGKHEARDRYLVQLYSNPTEVRNLMKRVFKGLGLTLQIPNRKRKGRSGLYVYEALTPACDFALMLAAKYTQTNVLGLLSTIRHTGNLSDPDKEWVDEGIHMYNTAAEATGYPLLTLTPPGGIRAFAVIPRRLRELEVEREHAGFEEAPTQHELERTRDVMHRVRLMRERVQRFEDTFAEQRHMRDLTVTAAVEVDDDDDASMSQQSADTQCFRYSSYVAMEANED